MIEIKETGLWGERYCCPNSETIEFSAENGVMTSSGEDAGDEEKPGF